MSTTPLQFRYELMSGVEITRAQADTMAAAGVPVRKVLLPESAAKQPRAIEQVKSIDVYANGGQDPAELRDYIDTARRTGQRPVFAGATCKGCFALGTACGHCERCTWEKAAQQFGPLDQVPQCADEAVSPRVLAVLHKLYDTSKLMCESLPVLSESSAAYQRKWNLDLAIAEAEKLLHGR